MFKTAKKEKFWVLDFKSIVPALISTSLFLLTLRSISKLSATFNFDPEFAYLYNGGVLMSGGTPGHTDHPGTSLQWISGLVTRVTYVLRPRGTSYLQDLVSNPDFYLCIVRIFLSFVFCICLFFFGKQAMKHLGAHLGITSIFIVFGGISLWYPWIFTLTPESLVASMSLLVLTMLLPTFLNRTQQPSTFLAAGVGAALSIGITGKIICLPLFILIPFVLRKKALLVLLLVSAASALLILFPVYSRFGIMWKWFTGVATNPDRYGSDPSTKWSVFYNLRRARYQIDSAFPYSWLITVVLISCAVIIVSKIYGSSAEKRTFSFFLSPLGLTAAVVSALGMGYKTFTLRDFIVIPFLASLLTTVVLFKTKSTLQQSKLQQVTALPSFLLFAVICCPAFLSFKATAVVVRSFDRQIQIQAFTNSTLDEIIGDDVLLNVYPVPSLEYASYFGNSWSGQFLARQVVSEFPNYLELNIWNKTIFETTSSSELVPVDCRRINQILTVSKIYLVILDRILADYWPDYSDGLALNTGGALIVREIDSDISERVFELMTCN